jgi:hypothetical protein
MLGDYRRVARTLALLIVASLWCVVRSVVLALLVIVEPMARVILSAVSLISLAMAFFFEFATPLSQVPFWGLLGVSLASLWLLTAYYALMRILSR